MKKIEEKLLKINEGIFNKIYIFSEDKYFFIFENNTLIKFNNNEKVDKEIFKIQYELSEKMGFHDF